MITADRWAYFGGNESPGCCCFESRADRYPGPWIATRLLVPLQPCLAAHNASLAAGASFVRNLAEVCLKILKSSNVKFWVAGVLIARPHFSIDLNFDSGD